MHFAKYLSLLDPYSFPTHNRNERIWQSKITRELLALKTFDVDCQKEQNCESLDENSTNFRINRASGVEGVKSQSCKHFGYKIDNFRKFHCNHLAPHDGCLISVDEYEAFNS
jgi:hypothetical protein